MSRPHRAPLEEVVRLRGAGLSCEAIAQVYGVTHQAISHQLRTSGRAEEAERAYWAAKAKRREQARQERRRQAAEKRRYPPDRRSVKVYSDEQMITALQKAAEVHGGPLSRKTYDEVRAEGTPTSVAMIWRFESWAKACAAAGVRPGGPGRPSYERRYSDADVVRFVGAYIAALSP